MNTTLYPIATRAYTAPIPRPDQIAVTRTSSAPVAASTSCGDYIAPTKRLLACRQPEPPTRPLARRHRALEGGAMAIWRIRDLAELLSTPPVVGESTELTFEVSEEMLTRHVPGAPGVLSTPAMIGLMETTASAILRPR